MQAATASLLRRALPASRRAALEATYAAAVRARRRTMALLFAGDRHDHLLREVAPLLLRGVHVVCDRYMLSSLVYQTAAGAPRELVLAANDCVRR